MSSKGKFHQSPDCFSAQFRIVSLTLTVSTSNLVLRYFISETCAKSKSSALLYSLLLCFKTPGLIPKPKGVIRQSSNLEKPPPLCSTHSHRHTHAHSLLVVIFLGGV